MKYNIEINDVQFYNNEEYSGLQITWDSNKGFGSFSISGHKYTEEIFMDDEHMSKEFVMELFSKLYDHIKEKERTT